MSEFRNHMCRIVEVTVERVLNVVAKLKDLFKELSTSLQWIGLPAMSLH
jgi:hypothetical protein